MAKKEIKLGSRVQYTDGAGFTKLAFVIGTRDSIVEGTDVPQPGKGEAHLLVVSPTGKQYTRTNVPQGQGARSFTAA